ncbi:MAG: CBS domain-containing protein [Candidatus Competibacteraceae bacterium]
MLSSINVKNYMTANLITFKPDMRVMDAISLLLQNRISAAPVVDKRGNLVGMLSEKDCMKSRLAGQLS